MQAEIHPVCMLPKSKPNRLFIFLFLRLGCGTSACAYCVVCLSLHVCSSTVCTIGIRIIIITVLLHILICLLIYYFFSVSIVVVWFWMFWSSFACVRPALVWLVTTICFLPWQTKWLWSWIHCMIWCANPEAKHSCLLYWQQEGWAAIWPEAS